MKRRTRGATITAVKMSVNLSEDAARTLKGVAEANGMSVTEAVRCAVSMLLWRTEVENASGKVLVAYPRGRIREVVFLREVER